MKKLLLHRNLTTHELLSYRELENNEEYDYVLVDAPEVEEKEGYVYKYVLDENNDLAVEYVEKEPTETELLEARLAQMQEEVAMLAEYAMLMMDADNEGV